MPPLVQRQRLADNKSTSGAGPELPPGWTADVITVAGELFLVHGYAGVSLASVMAKAGGSFRDLYREFGSKEGLFLRAMQYICGQVVTPWRSLDLQNVKVEEALILFGTALLSTLLSPRLIALHRLILSEATKFPKLAEVWYEEGPNQTNRVLGALLLARSKAGEVVIDDPCLQAALLLDSMVNNLQLRRLVGIPVSEAEIEERVRTSVQVFLHGVMRVNGTARSRARVVRDV